MIYFIGGIVIVALFIIITYNRLVKLRIRVSNAWSQIDNQLKRRYDLIPNLVEAVKGYAKHEQELFKRVTEMRGKSLTGNMSEKAKASEELSQGVKSLLAVSEAYPDLKASANFERLQIELVGTEDKIAYARQFYNDSVLHYNQQIMVFPNNLIAKALGFKESEYFRVNKNEKSVVEVDL